MGGIGDFIEQQLMIMVGREVTVRGELRGIADEMVPGR
jgi:hypothetical protein